MNQEKCVNFAELNDKRFSRFNEVKRILNAIASDTGSKLYDVFLDRLEKILSIQNFWEQGINFTITPIMTDILSDSTYTPPVLLMKPTTHSTNLLNSCNNSTSNSIDNCSN